MKNQNRIRFVSLILCGLLFAATALTLAGCSTPNPDAGIGTQTIIGSTDPATPLVLGEGDTHFLFSVTDGAGNTTYFEINTTKTIVGEALTELGMLAGDPGNYGLYVKTVNGITVDYDIDHAYWAFYENDLYASAGADMTAITPGASYAFKVEKG